MIGPHPSDPTKQLVRRVSLPPDTSPEYARVTAELASLDARILELQNLTRAANR